MSKQTKKEAEKQEAKDMLLKLIQPGDTIYTILRHVSSSGMSRRIDVVKLVDGNYQYLTGYVATLCGYRRHDHGPLVVSGCGMDMGFAVVYELSRMLFHGNYYCQGKKHCLSNDHSNGDKNYRKTHKHSDGGYAIRQRWL